MRALLLDSLQFLSGALVGAWIANRFQYGLERRREFNDARIPVRAYLLQSAENEPNPCDCMPSDMEFDLFVSTLSFIRRKAFLRTWYEHIDARQAALQQDPATGDLRYREIGPIMSTARACLEFTRRR